MSQNEDASRWNQCRSIIYYRTWRLQRGRLLYWAQDNRKRSLAELSQIQPEYMNVKERPEIFDGRRAHATEDFEGTRYTIIFYVIKNWMDADQHTYET